MARKFIYDVDTKNISFLQTAMDLKNLGIKNNMFFLKLYDISLRGVDPYSPFLTEEQIFRIINECVVNPWYFLREICLIPDQGSNGIPYQLNRANLAATWCFLNGIDIYEVIARQIGKTQSALAIIDWSFLFGTTNSEMMFLNKRQEDANENLSRMKQQRDLLPNYLQFKVLYNEGKKIEGDNNIKSLSNPTNNNKIIAKPSARSVEGAEGIGRGCTQPIQYFDEVEFTAFIKTIIEASGPAYLTASKNAKRNNAQHGRIFTSTPGDLDTQPGQDALLIIATCCTWTEKFYDWTKDDIDDYIANNSESGIVYIEYQYQQLGKDEEWFKQTCQILLNNPLKIKREIFLQRMRGSSESPFEPEDLAAIVEFKREIIEEIFINKLFKLDIYETLKKDRIYFIGVDVANGYGEDNSAVTIFDPYKIEPVAEFESPYIGVTPLTKFLYTLVRRHLPKSILCIERNVNGEAILSALRQTDIRSNLYFDNDKDLIGPGIDDKLDADGLLKIQAAKRKLYGVWTQGKSREIMMSLLERHIEEYKDKFITKNIIDDLLRLVKSKRGKIVAGAGFHDDAILSYLIVLYVFYHGNNLHRFGFVRGDIPDEEKRNKGLTYEEIYEELSEDSKLYFEDFSVKTQEDYNAKLVEEIQKARKETQYADMMMLKPVSRAENFEDDYLTEGTIPLDFFDELNK